MTTRQSSPDLPHHNWLSRRVTLPIVGLLRLGASPERLAWSLAVGIVVGINPVLGSTTILCLLLAFLLRLNIAASQLTNHLVYPLQILLLLPFLRLGSRLFHTEAMPFSTSELLRLAREHPVTLSRKLWLWGSHAFLLWLAIAAVVAPVLAAILTQFSAAFTVASSSTSTR